MRSEYKKSVIAASIGTVIFVLGIILFLSFPALFQFILNHELPLKPGSKTFELWKDLPLPLYLNMYFFTVTNSDDFLKYGTPPILEQKGPYAYRMIWTKNDIAWHSDNATVSFRENHDSVFVPELSNGTEDDIITTLNAPFVMTADFVRKKPIWFKVLVSLLFDALKEKLFIRRTVRELAFGGYEDILITLAPFINPRVPDMHGKFSWMFGKNATDDGLFNVFTGKGDLSKFNVIDRWNGQKYLSYWGSKYCNMMNGTNGESGSPVTKLNKIDIFRTDLCRSWTLTYEINKDHHGVNSKRFSVTRDVLANGTENSDNECFTVEEELPSGVYDASPCLYGAPTVMSLPHFYLGDPSYLEAIEGLRPEHALHNFYIDVEPESGATVRIRARIQLNVHLRKINGLRTFQDLKNDSLIFPVFWEEIVADLPEDQAKDLLKMLYDPKYYVGVTCYCLFAIGGAVALAGGIYLVVSWVRIKQELDDDDSLIDDEDEPTTNGRFGKDGVETAEDSPILYA